jgi:hypothetical protein
MEFRILQMVLCRSNTSWEAGRKPNTEIYFPSGSEGGVYMTCSVSSYVLGINVLNLFPNLILISCSHRNSFNGLEV